MTTTPNFIDPKYLNWLEEEWHACDPYLASLVKAPPAPTVIKIPPAAAATADADHDRGPLEGLARPVLAMLVRAEDEVGV